MAAQPRDHPVHTHSSLLTLRALQLCLTINRGRGIVRNRTVERGGEREGVHVLFRSGCELLKGFEGVGDMAKVVLKDVSGGDC